jgi:outer membrane protein
VKANHKHKKNISMKKLFLLAAFSVLFISTSITAQQKRIITLNEAIQLALENNYQLKQAENNLDLAEYRILSEKADFLPSISSNAGYSTQTGQQFVQETLSFTDVTSSGANGRISANLPIFTGFSNILTLRSSERTKLSNEETLKRAKENIIFETATRFLTVLLNKQQLEDAKESLETSKKLLEQTKAQVDVGSRPSVDLYNQEATVANDEFTVTQRENALKLSKLQLIRSLQIDPLLDYEFAVPDFNPESLEYQLQISKGSLLPTLSGSASISSSYSDQDPRGDFGDQFFDQRVNKSLSFSLNLPIFNNWNRMTQIQSAQVNLKNAELGLENTKLQVIQEITQALNDYSSYSSQLKAAEKSLIASEKAFETQQERYNVGASTLIELSQAQTQYFNAQSARTSALYNLIFQEKLLDYYVGKLSGDDIDF